MRYDTMAYVARPAAEQLAVALRHACESAGLTQEEVAEALDVHQTTVSKWFVGKAWPPLHVLPAIDRLCRKPTGHVLRLAGYVEDGGVDVLAAIERDPGLRDPIDRDVMRETYRIFSQRPVATVHDITPRLSPQDHPYTTFDPEKVQPNPDEPDELLSWEDIPDRLDGEAGVRREIAARRRQLARIDEEIAGRPGRQSRG